MEFGLGHIFLIAIGQGIARRQGIGVDGDTYAGRHTGEIDVDGIGDGGGKSTGQYREIDKDHAGRIGGVTSDGGCLPVGRWKLGLQGQTSIAHHLVADRQNRDRQRRRAGRVVDKHALRLKGLGINRELSPVHHQGRGRKLALIDDSMRLPIAGDHVIGGRKLCALHGSAPSSLILAGG